MTEAEARLFIEELRLAFPASKPQADTETEAALWVRDFGNVDALAMTKAVTDAIDASRYYPTLKEMRKRLERVGAAGLPKEGCRCEDGVGYYEAAPRQWIPCPACLPSTNRRWSEGHFAPGHWCEECARVTRGDGPVQIFNDHQRPIDRQRKLTVEENLDRLKIMQKLIKEVAVAKASDPGRYKRMSRAEIDKHWEDRFNALMQEGSEVDPVVVELFNADPGVPGPFLNGYGEEIL